jgi:hypothetical protein
MQQLLEPLQLLFLLHFGDAAGDAQSAGGSLSQQSSCDTILSVTAQANVQCNTAGGLFSCWFLPNIAQGKLLVHLPFQPTIYHFQPTIYHSACSFG